MKRSTIVTGIATGMLMAAIPMAAGSFDEEGRGNNPPVTREEAYKQGFTGTTFAKETDKQENTAPKTVDENRVYRDQIYTDLPNRDAIEYQNSNSANNFRR